MAGLSNETTNRFGDTKEQSISEPISEPAAGTIDDVQCEQTGKPTHAENDNLKDITGALDKDGVHGDNLLDIAGTQVSNNRHVPQVTPACVSLSTTSLGKPSYQLIVPL